MQDLKIKRVWGDEVNGCRISIAAARNPVEVSRPVELSIILANNGSAQAHSPRVSNWFDYEYTIVGPGGRVVPLTEFGRKVKESMQERGGTLLELKPGDELSSSVEVSRLYDFTQAGVYTIAVSKTLAGATGNYFKVRSNSISISLKTRVRDGMEKYQ